MARRAIGFNVGVTISSRHLADYVVHPRCTPDTIDRGFLGASLCNDLYVMDPAESPCSPMLAVVSAWAAIGRRRS